MHIELTEMLRCPEPHQEEFLVLSTGEMIGRIVRSGLVGCPVCRHEYPIVRGVVDFTGRGMREPAEGRLPPGRPAARPGSDAATLQALLELSGPGGYVVLLGAAARHAVGLAGLMGGVHFVGINPPADVDELPMLSLLVSGAAIPLRQSIARGVLVGADLATAAWLAEAHRVLLRGRRLVVEGESADPPAVPPGVQRLASAERLWVGAKG